MENNINKFLKKSISKATEAVQSIDVEELVNESGKLVGEVGNVVGKVASSTVDKTKEIKDNTIQKIKELEVPEITPEDIVLQASKVPGVKIDRTAFLYKELIKYYSEDIVVSAMKNNPAYAGVTRDKINEIANQVIDYETNKVSAISFAAGIPGGLAMAASIPADVAQYFGFMLRVVQKLAYLYGFDDFELDGDSISDETMNNLLIFLGVMFGVQGANQGIKIIAETASKKVSKSLAQKALTKTTLYPIVKKVATTLGFKMTKEVFAKGVSKVVPVVGGVVSGGLTYLTFKPSAIKLQDSFKDLNLSDPSFYNNVENIVKDVEG